MERERSWWFSPNPQHEGDLFEYSLKLCKNSDGNIEICEGVFLSNECKDNEELKQCVIDSIKEANLEEHITRSLTTFGTGTGCLATIGDKEAMETLKLTKDNINILIEGLKED